MIRELLAFTIASILSYHGFKKKSLDVTGSLAAFIVGYTSFACSYRFGLILILFYYSSSKLTKFKQDFKASIEEDYAVGGQRNWKQVFASSMLATMIAVYYYIACGEDQNISFAEPAANVSIIFFMYFEINKSILQTYLWTIYVAHYATANADTWASELGVLSKVNPRLVTSFFMKQVPRGTNGGMSVLGTIASCAGGLFIGAIFWISALLINENFGNYSSIYATLLSQSPMLLYSLVCGLMGSLIDSILGATLQATYYSKNKKCIVKVNVNSKTDKRDDSVVIVSGLDLLSNEAVNLLSILLTMILSIWLAPNVFCMIDSSQCYESFRINNALMKAF